MGAFTVTASVTGVSATGHLHATDVASAPFAITAGAGTSQDDRARHRLRRTSGGDGDRHRRQCHRRAPASPSVPRPAGPAGSLPARGRRPWCSPIATGWPRRPTFRPTRRPGGYIVMAKVAGLATRGYLRPGQQRPQHRQRVRPGRHVLAGHQHRPGPHLGDGGGLRVGDGQAERQSGGHRRHPRGPGLLGGHGRTARSTPSATPSTTARRPSCTWPSPIVGIAATPDGKGYWLVASDGGIFNYGDAGFHGSPAKRPPGQADRGHRRHPGWQGLLAGGVGRGHLQLRRRRLPRLDRQHAPEQAHRGHRRRPGWRGLLARAPTAASSAFGDATYYGSGPACRRQPVKAIVPTPDGDGYWVVSANGTAAGFGDAGAQGSAYVRGQDGRGRGRLGRRCRQLRRGGSRPWRAACARRYVQALAGAARHDAMVGPRPRRCHSRAVTPGAEPAR